MDGWVGVFCFVIVFYISLWIKLKRFSTKWWKTRLEPLNIYWLWKNKQVNNTTNMVALFANSHKRKDLWYFYTQKKSVTGIFFFKASKTEEFIPQTIWPYLLPFHCIILFYLLKAYRNEVCSFFKYYTFLIVSFLKYYCVKKILMLKKSTYLFSFELFLFSIYALMI